MAAADPAGPAQVSQQALLHAVADARSSRTRPAGSDPLSPDYFAEGKWARGFVDALSSRYRLRADIAAIVRLLSPRSRGDSPDRVPVPAWPAGADVGGDPGEDAWAVVSRARGPHRARADRWLAGYFDRAFEIRGDRSGGVDAVPQVAARLRLTPAELLSRGIIRGIVQPPAVSAG